MSQKKRKATKKLGKNILKSPKKLCELQKFKANVPLCARRAPKPQRKGGAPPQQENQDEHPDKVEDKSGSIKKKESIFMSWSGEAGGCVPFGKNVFWQERPRGKKKDLVGIKESVADRKRGIEDELSRGGGRIESCWKSYVPGGKSKGVTQAAFNG